MNTTGIGYLLLIFSLCLGLVLARFLVGYYFPQLTRKKYLSWFGAGLRIATKSLKVILEKQPMENLLAKNWRTLLVVAGILFAVFIWPTLHKDLPMMGRTLQRQNRITGEVQWFTPGVSIDWHQKK